VRERKRSEKARYQYYNDMAHAGRLGIMGEMAAGIAHELNQPLAAISLYLQGCLRRSEPESISREEMLYAIKAADEQATRAAGIIRRIKSFVRKEVENENLEIVDINLLIKRSVEFVLLDTKYTHIQPELLLASHSLKVKVDSLEIEQVLVNLIRNAIEAIVLHGSTPYFLKIHSNVDIDGNITVSVIDSGCGIECKNRDKIFDTYFTTKADGLGMGLAICRSIIEEHDGVLQYKPGEGGGAVFYFSLPLYG
jgi:C4-dicarboxylate-specific signal transduction histidine kinase